MKKYTVIYSYPVDVSRSVMVQYERIETDDLAKYMRESSNIWFVFDGWPEETKAV